MKTFNKSYLPESISYNGKEYFNDANLSGCLNSKVLSFSEVKTMLKSKCVSGILVKVLSNNLKRKVDLYGQSYKPSEWIFTAK